MKIYLYVKTHNVTGLKYLGMTRNQNPEKYRGSGLYWMRHIKQHGYNVSTEILQTCENYEQVKEWGLFYSKFWNVVQSSKWTNMVEETGDCTMLTTTENYKISRQLQAFKEKQALKSTGNTNVRGKRWWKCLLTGKNIRVNESPGEGWVEGFNPKFSEQGIENIRKSTSRPKSTQHKSSLSNAAKLRPSNVKGTVWVVNDIGKRKRVFPDKIPEGFNKVK